MQPEKHNVTTQSASIQASELNSNETYQANLTKQPTQAVARRHVKLAREISKLLPCVIPAIAALAATPALSIPNDLSTVYGNGMVLQSPDGAARPEGVQLNGNSQSLDGYTFQRIENLNRSSVTISNWQTRELPVTLPNGQTATAVFYGSGDYAIEQPGDAVRRGFTLPEERITFSADPEFLRNSGLNGIVTHNAFTGDTHATTLNPTEFGSAHLRGGMTTSANWMVVRDQDGKVIFEGKPATYGAQLYWNGTTLELSDAEGLQIGEGNYRTTTESALETTIASEVQQRTRQELIETQHTVQGQRSWDTVETQQRTETSIEVKPFQTQEVKRSRQNFDANLNSIFPMQNVAILHRDKENAEKFALKTDFQLSGDIQSESNPTLSGQVRIPLDRDRGTASLNLLAGGAPQNDQPGQPDFYALVFGQVNTPLFNVENGQHRPSRMVAGMRFGGGVFHVPLAAQVMTQTITKSGVDVITERKTFNDTTTQTWGQNFSTNFTQQTVNDYVDTFRVDTTNQTPISRSTTDVVVTRPDGSTFVANDFRQVSESRGATVSTRASALVGSNLLSASSTILPGSTQYSAAHLLAQTTQSEQVGADTTSDRIVQDVSVRQTVSDRDAWGTLLFMNPYIGNFDLASILKPGSLLYEVGGNLVRSSMMDDVSFKDSNLYLSLGMPVWNPGFGSEKAGNQGLLTIRAYSTYLPMTNDVRVGAGLQLSGL